MRALLPLLLLCAAAPAADRFALRPAGDGSLELAENGKTVFVYNYGPKLKPGVPEQFRRSSYLHPVYAPDGTLLSDDFPKDHYHHRGIFWAWRVVRAAGEVHDLWTIEGIHHRFLRWLKRDAGTGSARLALENGWFAGERRVMKETVDITAFPARLQRREIDFVLTLEAVDGPVEISGSPDRGYSGFGFRFAPRENTVIETDAGAEKEDTNLAPHRWAQLSAVFQGRRAGARIEVHPSNPAFPNGWCLRHYGYLGVAFPGLQSYRFEPGRPVVFRYRVTLFAQP
ncbi:MAG: PmoA family protein [Bryobacterales bacterium]|nr:PmoA family protein [Bryobacterales bacterium]